MPVNYNPTDRTYRVSCNVCGTSVYASNVTRDATTTTGTLVRDTFAWVSQRYPAIRQAGMKEERRDEFRETWHIMSCLPRLSEEAMHTAEQQRKAKRQNYGRKPRGKH